MGRRVFLLSPASCSGRRAELLLGSSRVALAARLRSPAGAPIGEVFSFISQLYFRGKLTYARAFVRVPSIEPAAVEGRASRVEAGAVEGRASGVEGVEGDGVFVITTSRGLVRPDDPVTVDTLCEFASVDLKRAGESYTRPLEAAARRLASHLGPEDEVVLLGSIASDKYVELLLKVFGQRLLFPRDFVGRGDMSRGGLMLRCARENRELEYVPLSGAVRHGVRPPRLG
jgi:hypothetical protein